MILRKATLTALPAVTLWIAATLPLAASAAETPAGPACIPYSQVFDESRRLDPSVPAELLPELPFGWAWIQEYEFDLNDEERWHWLSWPDGVNFKPC